MVAFIDLADAKAHVRVEHSEDDTYLGALIAAAQRHIETWTSIALSEREETFVLDAFPGDPRADCISSDPAPLLGADQLFIPLAPVKAASVSVTYLDLDGVEQELAPASLRLITRHGITRVLPLVGSSWPATKRVAGAVTVTATVGFAADASAPDSLKHAGRLLVGHWYRNREAVVTGTIATELPQAVKTLLETERLIIS